MADHIQIRNIRPKIQYIADGVTVTYSFPFAIFNADNIEVYCNNEKQNNYTVSFENNVDGGSITFNFAPENGTVITIIRYMNIERKTDFQSGGAIRAEELNNELDYQTACMQQLSDSVKRCVAYPLYKNEADIDLSLPTPQAGKCLMWSSDGKKLENSQLAINTYADEMEAKKQIVIEKAGIATANAQAAITSAQTAVSCAEASTQNAQTAQSNAEITTTNLELVQGIKDDCENIRNEINPIKYAKSDLSNIGYLTNCILKAPNGVFEIVGNNIVIKAGLQMLMPDGLNSDGAYKNILYTVESDLSVPTKRSAGPTPEKVFVGIDTERKVYFLRNYTEQDFTPNLNLYNEETYLNTKTNKFYTHDYPDTEWQEMPPICILGYYLTYESISVVGNIHPTYSLALKTDLHDLKERNMYPFENYTGIKCDLDNYLEPGVYAFCTSGTLLNTPEDQENGVLIVYGNTEYVKQIWSKVGTYDEDDSPDTYIRTYFGGDECEWTDWVNFNLGE